MTKKIYQNRNGYVDVKDFLTLIYNNQLDNYRRKFQVSINKCPPYELIDKDQICFYCQNCFDNCISQIKEYKDHYKIKNKKYFKEELNENK